MLQKYRRTFAEAGTKTTQTVLAHTEKYHDAYTTIDKIVDSFWERVPYICIAIIVLLFWLLTKLFKFFVRKTLENRSYTRQNLVLVLNRVGSTTILFWILNCTCHHDPRFYPRTTYERVRNRFGRNWFRI